MNAKIRVREKGVSQEGWLAPAHRTAGQATLPHLFYSDLPILFRFFNLVVGAFASFFRFALVQTEIL